MRLECVSSGRTVVVKGDVRLAGWEGKEQQGVG